MSKSSALPSYQFFKKLPAPVYFEYSKLEKAYNSYDASSAHRHEYYEILVFDKPGGFHEIDFKKFKVNGKSIHFICPGQVHLLKRKNNVTGHVIAFKKDFFLNNMTFFNALPFFSNTNEQIIRIGNNAAWKKIKSVITEIEKEYNSKHSFMNISLNAYMIMFFVEMMKAFTVHNNKGKIHHELTTSYLSLIEKNYKTRSFVSDYSSLLNVSAGHLNDTIKSDTGTSASTLLHERIILEAKRLLYHSSKSVKEISVHLNYQDPSYFNRFFKTNTGMSPLEFRKYIRKQYSF